MPEDVNEHKVPTTGHEELSEDIRQNTFNLVRKKYKSQSIWDRVVARINKKTPNWKKVAGYTQQELEYLLKVSEGNTYEQMREDTLAIKENDSREEQYRISDAQILKQANSRHWNQFLNGLNSGGIQQTDNKVKQKTV